MSASEPSEYITVAEAREILGVGKVKMAELIRSGVLQAVPSLLDRRSKLIERAAVERLKRDPKHTPQVQLPRTAA